MILDPSNSLLRPRPTEEVQLGGVWWKLTQPGSSVGTRLYRQVLALAGQRVLRSVVAGMLQPAADPVALPDAGAEDSAESSPTPTSEDAEDAAAAIRILREAHAGKVVAEHDLVELQLALAPLLPASSVEKLSALGGQLLWESQVLASARKGVYTGPNTYGADRSDRTTWERGLDAVIPDVATRSKLEVCAFLLLCRPSSAVSSTAR